MSALLHAAVNALVKISDDGLLTRGCMNATALVVAAPFTFFVPWPTPELWQFLIIATLVHGLYPFFLVAAYRYGDLSAIFPLARGVAPLGVVLLVALAEGKAPSWISLGFIVLISLAVASFAFESRVLAMSFRLRGAALAVATGLIISVYTTIDGMGLRLADVQWTYIVWLFVLDGIFVSACVTLVRRASVIPFLKRNWKIALTGGLLGVITYGLALLALGMGSIAEIAALRETSIVFASAIGALFLGEAFGLKRVIAASLVTAGVVGLRLVH